MKVTGINADGIYANNLTYSGTGTMTVSGAGTNSGISLTDSAGVTLTVQSGTYKAGSACGKAVSLSGTSPKIVIGSGTLEMTNKSTTDETHTFTIAATGNPWTVSGEGVTHTGGLNDNSISVTVPTGATGTVTSGMACAYYTLEQALAAAALMSAGEVTIRLLRNIYHTPPVSIEDAEIVFDLKGFDLTIDTSGQAGSVALTVNGRTVGYNTPGNFTVCGGEGENTAGGVRAGQGGDVSVSRIVINLRHSADLRRQAGRLADEYVS